jgi:hypothetical protein
VLGGGMAGIDELYDELPPKLAEETFPLLHPDCPSNARWLQRHARRRLVVEMMIMQSPNEQERFDFTRNLIIEAGDLALRYFGNLAELSIMSKGARDMVSDADLAVEKLTNEPVAGDGL